MKEYRVISLTRSQTGEVLHYVRQEQFANRDEAVEYAESFTPPKFEGAYVEQRDVSPWYRAWPVGRNNNRRTT